MTLQDIPTAELRQEITRRNAHRADPATHSAARLVARAASFYNISTELVVGDYKDPRAVTARWAVWIVMRRDGHSSTSLGKLFSRNHGTILNGWTRGGTLIKTDAKFAACIDHLQV